MANLLYHKTTENTEADKQERKTRSCYWTGNINYDDRNDYNNNNDNNIWQFSFNYSLLDFFIYMYTCFHGAFINGEKPKGSKTLKKKPSERGTIIAEKAGDKRGSSMSGKKVVVNNWSHQDAL